MKLIGYGVAAAGVAAITALIRGVPGASHLANISMLYLLVVIGTALRFGRGAAVAASLLAFFAFDWFFTQPHYTLNVRDPAEWLALFMFLVTAIVTGELTALLRSHADEARRREREAAALAEASWAVASQVDRSRALAELLRRLADVVELTTAAIVVPESASHLTLAASCAREGAELPRFVGDPEGEAARRVLKEGAFIGWEVSGKSKVTLASGNADRTAYLPLAAERRVLGVLYLRLVSGPPLTPEQRRAVESLAHHAAVVLERERLTRAETQARALEEADRLKTALLSMVSHDFRSPLASIKASASALQEGDHPLTPATQRELLAGIEHEADRLNGMVGNILALSRLEADAWRPRYELTDPAEFIGTALASFNAEQNRRIRVTLDPALAEVWLDPVQMVQVLHNLVDNALKYSPPESTVEVRTRHEPPFDLAEVLDRGPGLPIGEEERVFERFYRAPVFQESSVPGVGIGLAVCRGLVEAHGGTLSAHPRPAGGTVFRVSLPGKTTRRENGNARAGDR